MRIQIGNGKSTLFWHDAWLGDKPLKETLPSLFQAARFKNRTVSKELQGTNWIKSVKKISTTAQIMEYIRLWSSLQEVNINPDALDKATWLRAANGEYSARTAYEAQFSNIERPFDTKRLWKAKAEPKVLLFAWTAMYEKAPTADNLEAKGWDNNVVCPLCLTSAETNYHLLISCEFAQEVLKLVTTRASRPNLLQNIPPNVQVAQWLQYATEQVPKEHRRVMTGKILYAWWNIWKERNRRIFQGIEKNQTQVAMLAKEEADCYKMATTPIPPEPD